MHNSEIKIEFTIGKWGGFVMGDGEYFMDNFAELIQSKPDWFMITKEPEPDVFETTYIPNPLNPNDTTGWNDKNMIEIYSMAITYRVTKEEIANYINQTDTIGIYKIDHESPVRISDMIWFYLCVCEQGKVICKSEPKLHYLYNELGLV